MEFEKWWHEIGSGLPPLANEDQEAHTKRVAKLAVDAALELRYEIRVPIRLNLPSKSKDGG